MKPWMVAAGLSCALLLASCSTGEKVAVTPQPSGEETIGSLELRGHQFYQIGQYDSASAVLQRLLKLDPRNSQALRDIGSLHFELALREQNQKSPSRLEHLRTARRYFADLERQGEHDLELLDLLCETSLALGDNKGFLTYAKKSVGEYPLDRQYHNLGLAYFNVGDYQNAINVEKDAIEKFRGSGYVSSFYRLLGRAYMKVDRDQTAERILEEGLRVVEERLEGQTSQEEYRRMADDRTGILVSLKRLYQTYHKDEKLKQVDRKLLDAGYKGK
jgi:tetratricopeptide (TPR) repeat protein